jgi:hypothetical protein
MKDGYPTARELTRIRKWDAVKDAVGLVGYVQELWYWVDWGFFFDPDTGVLELHTGGWSGNESIIRALQRNLIFWTLYWQKSERGGHYRFDVKAL